MAHNHTITNANTSGFTLIELMIVVAIIGILAAIAIPQFSEYRVRTFNTTAQYDLRELMTNEEAFFVENESYFNSINSSTGLGGPISGLAGSFITKKVGYSIVQASSGLAYAVYTGHNAGDTTYAANHTGLMRKNKFTDNSNPRTSAASESNVLTSAWGTGTL